MISDGQFGFRNKRSCVLQLLTWLEEWTKAYDDSCQTDVIYLDIKKAFDSIPHNRLLLKLQKCGFEGNILNWVKDFLQHRRQRVCIEDVLSAWQPISSGVPQGSVLGPILFIIYMNNLPNGIQSMCRIFADDTEAFSRITSRQNQEYLQEDLLKICDWSQEWLLEFSVPKCKTMHVGNTSIQYCTELVLWTHNGSTHT